MTRIGLLSEGGIDEALLPPLLEQLVEKVPGVTRIVWAPFRFAPNGYGEILENLKLLTRLHSIPSEWERIGCDLIDPLPKLPSAPELDNDPKKTLTDLFVKKSKAIEFDRWNVDCARAVAPFLRASQIQRHCPRGFGKLARSFRDRVGGK